MLNDSYKHFTFGSHIFPSLHSRYFFSNRYICFQELHKVLQRGHAQVKAKFPVFSVFSLCFFQHKNNTILINNGLHHPIDFNSSKSKSDWLTTASSSDVTDFALALKALAFDKVCKLSFFSASSDRVCFLFKYFYFLLSLHFLHFLFLYFFLNSFSPSSTFTGLMFLLGLS